MTGNDEVPEEKVKVVVDCVLVDYRGDLESRDRVVHAILEWAEEHPDEWERLQARCQRRHEVPA